MVRFGPARAAALRLRRTARSVSKACETAKRNDENNATAPKRANRARSALRDAQVRADNASRATRRRTASARQRDRQALVGLLFELVLASLLLLVGRDGGRVEAQCRRAHDRRRRYRCRRCRRRRRCRRCRRDRRARRVERALAVARRRRRGRGAERARQPLRCARAADAVRARRRRRVARRRQLREQGDESCRTERASAERDLVVDKQRVLHDDVDANVRSFGSLSAGEGRRGPCRQRDNDSDNENRPVAATLSRATSNASRDCARSSPTPRRAIRRESTDRYDSMQLRRSIDFDFETGGEPRRREEFDERWSRAEAQPDERQRHAQRRAERRSELDGAQQRRRRQRGGVFGRHDEPAQCDQRRQLTVSSSTTTSTAPAFEQKEAQRLHRTDAARDRRR